MEDMVYKELLKIADEVGIIVLEDMLKFKDIEGLYINNGSVDFISLNVSLKDTPGRRNFVLAHELGHFIMHKDQVQEQGYKEDLEQEANDYASNLIEKIEEYH